MKALLIAEKPSLMREIQSVYNAERNRFDFTIDFLAQAGHLFTLKLPKEIDQEKYGKWKLEDYPTLYPYEYKTGEDKQSLVSKIADAIRQGNYDFIIHAGDPDGEGQLLIDETLFILHCNLPVKRFWSNDLTHGAILNALLNLQDNRKYAPIRNAALCRQHEDYQFGMNCTGIATLKMGQLSPLGRVKAIIIRLLVDRELAIENYVETRVYKPSFLYKDCRFVLDKAFDNPQEVLKYTPASSSATVTEVSDAVKTVKPPKLFKLSTLQTYMSKSHRWSGKKTLQILQSLYEAKAVSYPRTDCEFLSSAVNVGQIRDNVLHHPVLSGIDQSFLTKKADMIKNDKNYCNDKAISTEGHTAIIPTGQMFAPSSQDEATLYEVICRRFLSLFAPDKCVRKLKVQAIIDSLEEPFVFTHSCDIEPGFEFILSSSYEVKTDINITFKKNDVLSPIKYEPKEVVSIPPSRYTDGTLIAAMDKPENYESENGKVAYKIGTPATRAGIIDECERNGYFTKKGVSFIATDKAKTVIKLFGTIPLFNVTESGMWEEMLDKIRNGEMEGKDAEDFLNKRMEGSALLMKKVDPLPFTPPKAQVLGKCPKCGNSIADGKFGPYCTGKCGMTVSKAYGKELTNAQIKSLLSGKKTLIKGLISKKGTTYNAYLSPKGVSSFKYSDGRTGYSLDYDMEFER